MGYTSYKNIGKWLINYGMGFFGLLYFQTNICIYIYIYISHYIPITVGIFPLYIHYIRRCFQSHGGMPYDSSSIKPTIRFSMKSTSSREIPIDPRSDPRRLRFPAQPSVVETERQERTQRSWSRKDGHRNRWFSLWLWLTAMERSTHAINR